MGWFDDVVRRWRNEAAKRAATAAARSAARAVTRAGEELLGTSPGEAVPPEDEDRLGRAARIRAEAEARRAREEARDAQRERAEAGIARVGDLLRRVVPGGSDEGSG